MIDLTTSKKLPPTANCQLPTSIAQQCAQLGLLITFEGSEGCGKSTQIASLANYCREKNPAQEIVLLREPGGTRLGEEIRHLLQFSPASQGMRASTELLLFAASRAQLVQEVIRPALTRGAMVLCDRFLDSTTVYQGVARQLAAKEVAMINHFATGGLMPHATILLDLESAQGRARMKKRNQKETAPDRMEQEPESFYEAVRDGYLQLASAEPERWLVIDSSESAEKVSAMMIAKLHQKFPHVF